ncbi:MAG: hypothetical protein WCC14_21055, partial [Acidobacteriaceae bacterium]
MRRGFGVWSGAAGLLVALAAPASAAGQPAPATAIFDQYVSAVDAPVAREHETADGFLAPAEWAR